MHNDECYQQPARSSSSLENVSTVLQPTSASWMAMSSFCAENQRRTRKNVVDVCASTGGVHRGKFVCDGDVHFVTTGVVVVENSLLAWNWNWVLDWICSLWIWLWIWIFCSSYRQQRTRRSPGTHTRLPNVCNRFLLVRDSQPTWSHDVVRQCCMSVLYSYCINSATCQTKSTRQFNVVLALYVDATTEQ